MSCIIGRQLNSYLDFACAAGAAAFARLSAVDHGVDEFMQLSLSIHCQKMFAMTRSDMKS